MSDDVNRRLEQLESGRLSSVPTGEQSGWEMTLPNGQTVTRSILQSEARALIDVGRDAVPALLRWAEHDNLAVRYVATFALTKITGEHPFLVAFDREDTSGDRERALRQWRAWYDRPAPGGYGRRPTE
jgi:HEAT repeat protein